MAVRHGGGHRITAHGRIRRRLDQIAADLPSGAWQRYSAGPGPKGPRYRPGGLSAGATHQKTLII
jgi:hypothetical protein